ncbi:TRAF-like family protein [Citrus sinensis]|nr:TRAF-like family protein [Citrus sinensis]
MANDNEGKRSLPPADYIFKIKSFNLLADLTVDRFESGVFVSGGYYWRLVFYPKGNESSDHLSLYLKIDESNSYSNAAWSVNVYYRLFVYDQIRKDYLAVQDAKSPVRTFDQHTSEWGFGKFLTLAEFNQHLKGYLLNNTCTFGAEVHVIKPTDTDGTLSKEDSLAVIRERGIDCGCNQFVGCLFTAFIKSIKTLIIDRVPCLGILLNLE